MKKFLISAVAAVTLVAGVIPVAHAVGGQTVTSNFDVSVTLASRCKATNSGSTTVAFGTYTAFQASAKTATPALVTFDCTRGLAPVSFSFDTTNGTSAGEGVLAGLNYMLNTSAASVAGTAATAGASANGTADVFTVTIGGSMPANQSGQCGTISPTQATAATCDSSPSHTRILTVTY